VSELRYSDGIAAARTLVALEANASSLQRRLPQDWELFPYSGDDLRGTSLCGANMLVPFHEVYAARRRRRARRHNAVADLQQGATRRDEVSEVFSAVAERGELHLSSRSHTTGRRPRDLDKS
jgi:hypothetical protein